ncbi:MAG: porin family protein [Candidatus Omnitrophota bacterium]
MKRNILNASSLALILLALFVISPVNLNAQLQYGIKVGANFNRTHITGLDADLFTENQSNNLSIGIFFNYPFIENTAIQFGAYYVTNTLNLEWTAHSGVVTPEWKIESLQLPLFLKYAFAPEAKISPYLLGGGYGAYRIKVTETIDGVKDDAIRYFKPLDFGLVFGAGIDYRLFESLRVTVEARYNLGLTQVHDVQVNESSESYEIKNRSFTLGFGISF